MKITQNVKRFTMIELLLVIAILGALAAIVVPKFSGRTEQANVAAVKTQIAGIETALDAFEIDNGRYASEDEGMDALIDQPDDLESWRGPYLKKRVGNDPWGNEYIYRYPGENNVSGYDLSSMGPDGQEGTEDDISNWTEE